MDVTITEDFNDGLDFSRWKNIGEWFFDATPQSSYLQLASEGYADLIGPGSTHPISRSTTF